jgi:hypothetical protein
MKTLKSKFTSRKFLVCVAGILTGIGVVISGNTIEGVSTILASIIAYLVAEGYVDAKAIQVTDEVIDTIKEKLEKGQNDEKLL